MSVNEDASTGAATRTSSHQIMPRAQTGKGKAPRPATWVHRPGGDAPGSAGRSGQAPDLVLPSGAVAGYVGGWQAAVREHDHRVVAVRGRHDLNGRTAGRQGVAAGDAP